MTPLVTAISANPASVSVAIPEQASEREQLAATARQFEAIFLRQILAAARKADHGDELFSGQGLATFREMQDDHFANIAAETGTLGLASIIEAQLARHLPAER